MDKPFKIAVLISGNGSNLQAIIDKVQSGDLAVSIAVVVSDKANAYGLQRAKQAGIQTQVLDKTGFPTRQEYDAALTELLLPYQCNLIVLSGFMRILTAAFIDAFKGKIINIHPSLLPKYPGLHTFEKALANGDKEHGTTVHYVTEDLDAGPIIAQKKVPILADDDAASLKAKTQQAEYELYWQVIKQLSKR